MRRDQRSPEAVAYRRLYQSTRWLRLRARQITKQPLCERHLAKGQVVIANTVHHRKEHKGDPVLFWDSTNLESVCASCHSGVIQQVERIGYSTEVGEDGWPTDERHPSNRR